MKLIFKQQPYQTDTTMAVVRCFDGRQGKGFRKEVIGRTGLFTGIKGTGEFVDKPG